jgi:hypothetical protein
MNFTMKTTITLAWPQLVVKKITLTIFCQVSPMMTAWM